MNSLSWARWRRDNLKSRYLGQWKDVLRELGREEDPSVELDLAESGNHTYKCPLLDGYSKELGAADADVKKGIDEVLSTFESMRRDWLENLEGADLPWKSMLATEQDAMASAAMLDHVQELINFWQPLQLVEQHMSGLPPFTGHDHVTCVGPHTYLSIECTASAVKLWAHNGEEGSYRSVSEELYSLSVPSHQVAVAVDGNSPVTAYVLIVGANSKLGRVHPVRISNIESAASKPTLTELPVIEGKRHSASYDGPAVITARPNGDLCWAYGPVLYWYNAEDKHVIHMCGNADERRAFYEDEEGSSDAWRFHTPAGLAVDKDGGLWIADSGSNEILFIDLCSDGINRVSHNAGLAMKLPQGVQTTPLCVDTWHASLYGGARSRAVLFGSDAATGAASLCFLDSGSDASYSVHVAREKPKDDESAGAAPTPHRMYMVLDEKANKVKIFLHSLDKKEEVRAIQAELW